MHWVVEVAGRNLKPIACAWFGLSVLLLVVFLVAGTLFPDLNVRLGLATGPVLPLLKAVQDGLFYLMIFGAAVRIAAMSGGAGRA